MATAQRECSAIAHHNREERVRVHTYFGSISSQLNEMESELKTSITILVEEQRQHLKTVFEEIDSQFVRRLTELDLAGISLDQVTKEIDMSIKVAVSNRDVENVIRQQRLILAEL